MEKIKMTTPIVEMDGDEMTRILWKMIKEHLLKPFIELNTEYYDLGLGKTAAGTGPALSCDYCNLAKVSQFLILLRACRRTVAAGAKKTCCPDCHCEASPIFHSHTFSVLFL